MPDDPPSDFDRYLAQVEQDAHAAATDEPPRPGLAERLLRLAIVGGGIALYGGAAWAVGRRMGWW